MDYNFLTLNTRDFEHLVQSLTQKILGENSIVFGDGPDGARELTFRGKASFPSTTESWDGYWIIQAKFKSRKFDTKDDFVWVKRNFISEMGKFQDKKRKIELPNNYLFFTNTRLSPVQSTGGRDKIEKLKEKYTHLIPNIYIASYDELCKLLDNNREVATAYSSFILAGDILVKLYDLLKYEEKKKLVTQKLIINYLEKSFNDELFSKLIQAGDLTNQINIEKVFIDIDVTDNNQPTVRKKFLEQLINLGNSKWMPNNICKLVLVGGAGSGKSTLSQFASQIYSAFFVFDNMQEGSNSKIKNFISDFKICSKPNCLRFPFKIVLKDFATWIKEQNEKRQSKTVLNYIKNRIETKGDGILEIETLREFLGNISSLFIFDGLDEVPVTSNRDEVIKEINDFIEIELKNQKSDTIILCTTRQQGYTKEFDENTFQHFFVAELSDNDCLNYLKKLLSNIEPSEDDRQNYYKTLNSAIKDDVTGRLMRTPLQATIMTILVKSGGKPSRNKYNLFKEYYETIYKRELQKELLPILKDYKRNIDYIHALLGFELQAKSEGRENPSSLFESREFQILIRMYLRDKEEWEEKDIDSFINKITNAVTERLVFIGEIQDNKIGFIIRSLQEYFAANYLINYKDDIVIDNLKEIANSSYWRNTFLFAVSGLHNTKNHLIDQVYLHCERLNGNEDNPNIPSIYNSIFCGSWLSLEILSEGIFSDSPKNRNRFVRLLEKLFQSINTIEINKIEYLPTDIVIDIIIQKHIKEILLSDSSYIEKFASFKLSFLLIKNNNLNSHIIEILNKSWTTDYEFKLINLMFDSKISDTVFFIDKLHNALLKDNYLIYIDIFRRDFSDEYKITKSLVKLFKKNDILVSRIIEISFLAKLNQYVEQEKYNVFALFNEILGRVCFSQTNNFAWNILSHDNKTRAFEIVDGFSISVALINSENVNLDFFSELFQKYSLQYLKSYIDFIKDPNSLNLCIFFENLKTKGDSRLYKKISSSTRIWLFKEIYYKYNDFSQIDSLINALKNNEFGDYSDWVLSESKLIQNVDFGRIIKYAMLYTRNSSSNLGVLNNFYNKFKSELGNNDLNFKIQFMKLFVRAFEDKFGNDKDTIPDAEIFNAILSIINGIDVTLFNNWQLDIFRNTIIIYLKMNRLNDLEKINSNFIKVFNFESYDTVNGYLRDIYLSLLKDCVSFYNHYISIDQKTFLGQLVLFLLFSISEFSNDQIKNIRFKTKDIQASDSIYDIILRLISNQVTSKDFDLIINKSSEYDSLNTVFNIVSKLFLNLKINETWCNDFFVRLHNYVINEKDVQIILIQNIQLYLKFIHESKMTEMKNSQITSDIIE